MSLGGPGALEIRKITYSGCQHPHRFTVTLACAVWRWLFPALPVVHAQNNSPSIELRGEDVGQQNRIPPCCARNGTRDDVKSVFLGEQTP